MSAVATPGASFTGADVDGLDRLSAEFSQAATICDEVKAACEAIVAASFVFGPFGAAFVAYLKGTVIPWLTKISEALQAMAKVLSARSQAQQSASSPASLTSGSAPTPTYSTPTGLPATSTTAAPTPPSTVGPGTQPVSSPTTATAAGATQVITAVTGLLTAIGKLAGVDATTSTPITGTSGLTAPTTPGTDGSTLGTGALGGTGDLAGTSGLASLPGVTIGPVNGGDAVGVLSVPVAVSPDGHITPLLHTAAADPTTPTMPTTPTTPALAVPHTTPSLTAHDAATRTMPEHGTTGGSFGGGASGGGGSLGGSPSTGSTPAVTATPIGASSPLLASSPSAHVAPHSGAAPLPAAGPGVSHDGLYAGLGQATGIGAGAAALARVGLHELRQRAEGGSLGAISPFDADADGLAATRVFTGELGD